MSKTPGPDSNQIRMSFDWFEYARLRGSYQLWTEDWMPDSASFRWSYYASRLRSSIALANHDGMEFSGYIVPRSSGGRDGGLLQRIVTLIGSGAKGVRYFDFGPEYTFPISERILFGFVRSCVLLITESVGIRLLHVSRDKPRSTESSTSDRCFPVRAGRTGTTAG